MHATAYVQGFRLAIAPNVDPVAEAAERVQAELPAWWQRTAEWLELFGSDHIKMVDHFHWSTGSPAIYFRDHAGQLNLARGKSWMREVIHPHLAWKRLVSWEPAVYLAGAGLSPPLACTLLVDALRAFRNGEWHLSVLNSGTAAELSLVQLLTEARHPPSGRATLGQLRAAADRHLPGVLPSGFQDLVVCARNDAAHRGDAIGRERALIAFDLVQRLARTVHPLLEDEGFGLTLRPGPKVK